MDALLQKLIEFLQGASPMIWHTLMKQVYMNAVGMFAWAIILLIPAVILLNRGIYARKMMKQEETSHDTPYGVGHWEDRAIAFIMASIIPGAIGLFFLTEALGYIINPQFYAIQLIISSLGGG